MKITNWRKTSRCRTIGLRDCRSGPSAADLQTNLVANPGFELIDENDPGPFTSVRILNWDDADLDGDDNFAYPYSSAYSGDPAPPGSGDYHFTGGFGTSPDQVTITQSFDVSGRRHRHGHCHWKRPV